MSDAKILPFKSREQIEIDFLKREINTLRDEMDSLSENLTEFMAQVQVMANIINGGSW